jgi:hypothetical protein
MATAAKNSDKSEGWKHIHMFLDDKYAPNTYSQDIKTVLSR